MEKLEDLKYSSLHAAVTLSGRLSGYEDDDLPTDRKVQGDHLAGGIR